MYWMSIPPKQIPSKGRCHGKDNSTLLTLTKNCPTLSNNKKGGQQHTIWYTYPQLQPQNAAQDPGSIFNQYQQSDTFTMKKTITSILFLLIIGALHGCAGIKGSQIDDCPTPSKDQFNKNGALIMQDGVTLKCQAEKYIGKMSCEAVTNPKYGGGLVCEGGKDLIMFVFLFDENGILKGHKFF